LLTPNLASADHSNGGGFGRRFRFRSAGRQNCSPYWRTIAGGRHQANADGPALVDEDALCGDPPEDILRCQYRRHRLTSRRIRRRR
jgi:hypothetical protein